MPNLEVAPVEHVVQGDVALGHGDRVVPRENDNHRAHVDALRPPREVGEELRRVVDHRVGREVVLHGPERIEPERLDQLAEAELLLVDLGVADGLRRCIGRRQPRRLRSDPNRCSSGRRG